MAEVPPNDLGEIQQALAENEEYAESQRRRRLAIAGTAFAAFVPFIVFFMTTVAAAAAGAENARLVGLGASVLSIGFFGYYVRRQFRYLDPAKKHTGGIYAGFGLAAFVFGGLAVWIAINLSDLVELPILLFAFAATAYILQGLETRSGFWFGTGLVLAGASMAFFSFAASSVHWIRFGVLFLVAAAVVRGVVFVANRRRASA